MKHISTLSLFFTLSLCSIFVQAQENTSVSLNKAKYTILYFNPEIEPEVEEIKGATFEAFFSAVSDYYSGLKNTKILRSQTPITYNDVNKTDVTEGCFNNNAQFAVIPKVKFFKIGFGKYILSSQVIVSMKLYDAQGNLLSDSSYDTFKKKARILGSAENSVKLGTHGALKILRKEFQKGKRNYALSI